LILCLWDPKLNNEPSVGTKLPKSNAARNSAEKIEREGIVIKTAGRHSPMMKHQQK
jgi:hypothetical protein